MSELGPIEVINMQTRGLDCACCSAADLGPDEGELVLIDLATGEHADPDAPHEPGSRGGYFVCNACLAAGKDGW